MASYFAAAFSVVSSVRRDTASASTPAAPVAADREFTDRSCPAAAAAAAPRTHGSARSSLPCLMAVLLSALPLAARADDGWQTGRATFYGNDGGATIDQGSCMYGSLPNGMVSTGTDIAAIADVAYDFGGSCGRCYEVQCNPSSFSDGYGNYIDRSGNCYGDHSVIVTITDTCPCNYPANAYSNRRWCCGDMYHMDLSQQAFSKIADIGVGVVGIRFRQVECPGGFHPSPRAASSDFLAGTGR